MPPPDHDTKEFERGERIGEIAAAVKSLAGGLESLATGLRRLQESYEASYKSIVGEIHGIRLDIEKIRAANELNRVKVYSAFALLALGSGGFGGAMLGAMTSASKIEALMKVLAVP